jgi:SsrA-binding protein
LRPRKLLLHGYEIKKLAGKITERGYALIPLRLYFREGKVKVLLGLAKGKRKHDKRETIRRRDQQRDLDRQRKDYK